MAVKRGDELSYVFQDHLNSPVLETDTNAAVVTRWKYEPYGTMRGNEWTLPTDKGYAQHPVGRRPEWAWADH